MANLTPLAKLAKVFLLPKFFTIRYLCEAYNFIATEMDIYPMIVIMISARNICMGESEYGLYKSIAAKFTMHASTLVELMTEDC